MHGYHLGVDDSAIYIPAIKHVADSQLYPFGSEFFLSHAHLTLFPELIGYSGLVTRLPLDFVIFLWHIASILLLLIACWGVVSVCFENSFARWGGVALIAALLTVPVAGTALVMMDPYLTARSLSSPFIIFAIGAYLSRRPGQAAAWLFASALIHPQMCIYGLGFLACVALTPVPRLLRSPAPASASLLLPFGWELQPARGIAREVLHSRTYFFLSNWSWYEWAGLWAPLAILYWLALANVRGTTPVFRSLCRALIPFGFLFTMAALTLTSFPLLENFTRLQPLRAFHLIYMLFFCLLGGVLGEYVLRRSVSRWIFVFVPLAAVMLLVQRNAFSSSRQVEWPGAPSANSWISAFYWIRTHTPKDAVFAIDPAYFFAPGEDQHGFRAIAERSVLADQFKDSGVVSLFPGLGEEWKQQVEAQNGWKGFRREQFENLARKFPITWILTRLPAPAGLVCPYENRELAACRVEVTR